jgi:hypothetical protein
MHDTKIKTEALEIIAEMAHLLGWEVALPEGDSVHGIIIGTSEFIEGMNVDVEVWNFGDKNDPSRLN